MSLKNVICGISGGVDSAVSAHLLKCHGYNVLGVFMKNWDVRDELGFCNADVELEDAQYTCSKLGIHLTVANFVKEYWNEVFSELIKDYQNGFTPNPDIICNKKIKFKVFQDHCFQKFDIKYIATGHYARISKADEYGVKLLQAADKVKDQTFFLSQIPQEGLRNTLFPLGNMNKKAVKQLACEIGLGKIAKKKESTGICFIGKRNFKKFINDYVNPLPGNFVHIETGEIIGQHEGIHFWTIGQRCHIPGKASAFYIAEKNCVTQEILVAPGHEHDSLYHTHVEIEPIYFIHSMPNSLEHEGILNCYFRFQNTHQLVRSTVIHDENRWFVQFDNPIRALTPGQYAVFYLGEECLGSARILKTLKEFVCKIV